MFVRFWLVPMGILFVSYMTCVVMINRRMRFARPERWEEMGRKTFWNNSPTNSITFQNFFIFTKRYVQLEDSTLNSYARIARILYGAFAAYFFAGLIMFFSGVRS